MEQGLKTLFYFLVFPGLLFTAACGLIASWVDRKVTARVQWRVGPPWYQPLIDIVKLLGKETLVPKGSSKLTFLLAPLVGLAGITLVSSILWLSILYPGQGFVGDLIVVVYLLAIPSIALIIGGFASRNPYASLGASREMKLILSYELPFILAILVPIIKAGGAIRLGEFLAYQGANGLIAGSASGTIALIVVILAVQAKLALVPFDIPDAETEIMGGIIVEYSGASLAAIKLTKAMMLFTLPVFAVVLFLGGISTEGIHLLWGILKCVGLIALVTLIRNTNPRVRIDQAVRFFWGPVTILAIIAVALALMGL
jgi:NADH-quinone oxidoreductase subunit H